MSEESRPSETGRAGMRASDADREQLITELHEHTVAGRLTTDDLEERLHAAYTARTTGELDTLRSDLPVAVTSPSAADRGRRARLTRRLIQETGGSAGLFVVCVAIWLSSGANGQFWPGWVLIVVVLSLVRNAWGLFGPAPDLDAVEHQLDARRERRLKRDRQRSSRRQDR